ncbi:MAG: insulinase family protein [Fimbriimonadaceae bacterium]|nr:insulinase family protein [Fimbriimonadaceae bacterium]
MFASLACAFLIGQSDDILQKELPNGAKYRIERTADKGEVIVSLFVSQASMPGDGGVAGTRHLLEHLIAKGPDGMLDRRLESMGLALVARTERDGASFVIMGPSDKAAIAVEAIRELFAPLKTSQEEIDKEIRIIDEEGAFRANFAPFLDAAWAGLFEPAVPSVHGDIKAMATLTPEKLASSASAFFASGGLSLFIAGDIDPAVIALRATEVLSAAPQSKVMFAPRDVLESIGKKTTVNGAGNARAVISAGIDRPMTLARLGTALAMQRMLPGIVVTYEASCDRGPILLYADSAVTLEKLRSYGEEDLRRIAPLSRGMAVMWCNGMLLRGPDYAVMKAKLLRQQPTFNLEGMRDTAYGLTDDEIWDALRDWQGSAMHIEGTR